MTRARAIAVALAGFLLAVPARAEAQQNAVITGRVTTEFGQPLEGANVYITELTLSVGTNAEGNYSITVPAARVQDQQVVLRVRAFGYVPEMRPIRVTAGTQTVNFQMRQDVSRLQEVVVTGVTAGTEQRNLPFTVARIDEREMPVPSANPLTQLQGKVPGANIVSASGRPGAAPAVLLRGPKSINAQGRSQEPLYIVDGVVLNGRIDDINPADIESVEVVKGAAASSLYGSRAGNGVIQITTKSGSNQATGMRFNARSEYGRSEIENEFRLAQNHHMMMDETRRFFCRTGTACGQTFSFEREARRINEDADLQSLPPLLFEREAGISSAPGLGVMKGTFQVEQWTRMYNPVRQLVTAGQRTNNTLDASGRFGGTSFFTSLNNLWEEGAMRGLRGYTRNSGRLNLDQTVGDNWTFGLRTYYARALFDGREADPGGGFFRVTRNPAGANLLALDNQGRLYIRSNPMAQGDQNYNPVYAFANFGNQENDQDRFLGAMTARYTPLDWLDFDANFAYERSNRSQFYREDRGIRVTTNIPLSATLGYMEQWGFNDQAYNSSLSGTARQNFGDLETRFTARYLYEQQDLSGTDAWGSNLATPGLRTLRATQTGRGIDSFNQSIRSIGMMAGVDAIYAERYIIGLLGRRDGSSLFGADNRWANYGRGSLAWRVSDEAFWVVPGINEFKLRSSIGTAGGRPSFAAQYETYNVSLTGQLTPATAGNAALRPETVTETEFGADLELLNRYGVSVTYAASIAADQILPVPQPAITGFTTRWENAGTLDNKTWEASVNIPLLRRRDMNWSARVNYDQTRTMITKLETADGNKIPPFLGGAVATNAVFRFEEGLPYATWWGRSFVKSCSQLPSTHQAQCGPGQAFQQNDDGFIVWVGEGNLYTEGITKNLWNAQLPAGQAPWSRTVHWGMPILVRNDTTGVVQLGDLGSALPKYRLGGSSTFNYRRFFAYSQLDGSFGQRVWNQGRHWSLGDFMTAEIDQRSKDLGTAKPLGYYWRNGPPEGIGIGGFYDVLGPNNVTVETASYLKLRELNLSYNIGAVRGAGDWTVGVTGRNLLTFTDYTGFDPEVGRAGGVGGSAAVNGVDAYGFPNLRTFTLSVGTRF